MEDNEIIKLYCARSENAIKQTEIKYSRYLFTIALNILNSREDSSECVNDTYLKAWNSIPPARPTALSCYLGRITRNLSIDRLRKKTSLRRGKSEYELSLEELEECAGTGDSPEELADLTLLAELIGTYLGKCGTDAARIFVCRYYYCDSIDRICTFTGYSISKVKSILFRTRKGLREYLGKEGFDI